MRNFNLVLHSECVTELNVSHNQMSKLPDELCDLAELHTLDISHNAFISLPRVAFKMPKLANLNANHNRIIGKLVPRGIAIAAL